MAKRKKTKKTTRRRRRSMGAAGMGEAVTTLAGLTAGAIAGAYVSGMVKARLATLPKFAAPAGVVAIGYFVPKMLKSNLGKAIGAGMQAVGGLQLLNTVVAIPGLAGLGAILDRTVPRMNNPIGAPGFVNTPINGLPDRAYMGSRMGNGVGALYDN